MLFRSINVPEEDGKRERQREISGYEYYNGTGYLLFRDSGKMDVERLTGIHGDPGV